MIADYLMQRNSGQKRKSPEEAGALEPEAKAEVGEDEIAPGPWRTPVARTW